MMFKDFSYGPKRVWINQPSKLQQHYLLHGKVGIAMIDKQSHKALVVIYFTEGTLQSMLIAPSALNLKLD